METNTIGTTNPKILDRGRYHAGLNAVDSTSGREVLYTEPLELWLSEGALHSNRALVQVRLLIALSQNKFPGFPTLDDSDEEKLSVITKIFDPTMAADYDHFGRNGIGPVEHDIKAVELTLRELFNDLNLEHLQELIHLPATSEDINNLAWNMMLRNAINQVWLPKLMSVCDMLGNLSLAWANLPVLGKTHGMNATPTTFGKRFAYFLGLITDVLENMSKLQLSGKFSGPTGNHNAVMVAAPDFDFPAFAKQFVESFGFTYKECQHQRNSHLEVVELLNKINLINIIAADLCEHVRLGTLMGWYYQIANPSHTGSSVMPHKVNPWWFEVGQGYFEQSIALIQAAGPNLIQSMFERDLTDHPWEREYGSMIAKSLIGLSYLDDGLKTLRINEDKALAELQNAPEVLTEAIQIVGRIQGVENIYMKIKEASRGKNLDLQALHTIIDQTIDDKSVADRLKQLQPEHYTGQAYRIVNETTNRYIEFRMVLTHGILHPFAGIKAILYDFDSTLHFGDKEELFARLSAINANLNLGLGDGEIKEICKESDFRKMKTLLVSKANEKRTDHSITEELIQNENDKVTGSFDYLLVPAEGAAIFLQRRKEQGYPQAVVTTRGTQSLMRMVKKYEYHGNFNAITHRDTPGQGKDGSLRIKPHPEPVAITLKKLGIPASLGMFIGDKQTDDIIAGKALGMKTVLITPEELDPYGAKPDFHFKTFAEFADYFETVTSAT